MLLGKGDYIALLQNDDFPMKKGAQAKYQHAHSKRNAPVGPCANHCNFPLTQPVEAGVSQCSSMVSPDCRADNRLVALEYARISYP